jgi:hypothetical protein
MSTTPLFCHARPYRMPVTVYSKEATEHLSLRTNISPDRNGRRLVDPDVGLKIQARVFNGIQFNRA